MTVTTTAAPVRVRNDAVDLLRGIVMVVMALDHVRDFFTNHVGDPGDVATTTAGLFLTRWVTHFCAPVFVFLAGAGVFLSGSRGKSPRALARFLVTRGLWLVVVELTVVRWGWFFDVSYRLSVLQVMWALGMSMIVLAGLVFLPTRAVAAFGAVLVVGHDALDGVHAAALGRAGWVWTLVHERGMLHPFDQLHLLNVIYPLVPWIGVMALGYAFGALLLRPAAERRRLLLGLGVALTLAFVALRALDGYGDPRPWTTQRSPLFTLFSFLACSKYPPSLAYLLMTLGPAITFLGAIDAAVEGGAPRWARPFVTFGRVPFFYYVLHVPLLHGAAVALGALLMGAAGATAFAHKILLSDADTARFGFSLPVVYLAWALVVLALYPPCRWFAGVKARNRSAWLSYL
jgi:uncharacterized membrane protein